MQPEEIYKKLSPYIPFFYFCLLALMLFSGNGHSLFDQDEAAYAGFAKQMTESGNWVIPEFMWSEVHRKPPLHFWNIALSYTVFGVNEFAVRFPAALFTLLTFLLMYFAGKKQVGKRLAFIWVLVLSTSLLVPALAKISVTDSTLLFFTTTCAFALWFILQEKKWKWVFVFWLSFALALLTKGPPVVLFAFVLITLLAIMHPNRKNLIMLHPWFFLPLAFAPLIAWGYATMQYDGGKLVAWMIDWYILKRVGGSVFGQTGFPGMHLLLIILFFLPWFMFVPQALGTLFKSFIKDKREGLFFSAWFIAGWLIYELSPSKLPAYVLAAHIPLAFFIARYVNEQEVPAKAWIVIHYLFAIVLSGALIAAPFILHVTGQTEFLVAGCGIILLGSSVVSLFVLRTRWFFTALTGVAILLQFALWVVLLPVTETYTNTTNRVARYAAENADKESRVFIANGENKPPSLPFYLGTNFKTIAEEYDLSVLMAAYYADAPAVFILNEKQSGLFVQLIPGVAVKKIQPPLAFNNVFTDYYLVIKSRNTSADEKHNLPEWVKQPPPVKTYEESIRRNATWMQDIAAKAEVNKVSPNEMIIRDASWMYENDLRRYIYLSRMLQTPRWKKDLEKRAAEKGISLEKMCNDDVEFIFKQGKVY